VLFRSYIFPFLSEFDEVEIQGLEFSGSPDFQLIIGYDDDDPFEYLTISVPVFDTAADPTARSRSTLRTARVQRHAHEEPVPVEFLGSPQPDLWLAANERYVIGLSRKNASTSVGGDDEETLLLRIADGKTESGGERDVFQGEFRVPRKYLDRGCVSIRAEAAAASPDWGVRLERVLIRGVVDHARVAADSDRKGTSL
ncbi:MAG: hypothetical protein KDC38_21125, partial [Planctomycetes bacterium]|nr:hypothetical protein [Planctomycetota bacterium]